MSRLSAIGRWLWDGLKRYPITIAMRGTVILFLLGLAVTSINAAAAEGSVALMAISSYLIEKTVKFFHGEIGPATRRLLFPYEFFELIWYVLSWPSEVPDRES